MGPRSRTILLHAIGFDACRRDACCWQIASKRTATGSRRLISIVRSFVFRTSTHATNINTFFEVPWRRFSPDLRQLLPTYSRPSARMSLLTYTIFLLCIITWALDFVPNSWNIPWVPWLKQPLR